MESSETKLVERLASDMTDVKATLDKVESTMGRIAEVLTKMALLEERQAQQTQITAKMVAMLDEMKDKQHEFEIALVVNSQAKERLDKLEAVTSDLNTRVTAYETAGKTVGKIGAGVWAVVGGAVTGAVSYFARGG
jgi:BMFP domain-containing protein YqiC